MGENKQSAGSDPTPDSHDQHPDNQPTLDMPPVGGSAAAPLDLAAHSNVPVPIEEPDTPSILDAIITPESPDPAVVDQIEIGEFTPDAPANIITGEFTPDTPASQAAPADTPDEETRTIGLSGLFDAAESDGGSPSSSAEQSSGPHGQAPRPVMTQRELPDADGQDTPSLPIAPVPPRPQSSKPVRPERPEQPAPRPKFNPSPRPPVRDEQATVVNPRQALSERALTGGKSAEDIRRRRRAQRRQQNPPPEPPKRDSAFDRTRMFDRQALEERTQARPAVKPPSEVTRVSPPVEPVQARPARRPAQPARPQKAAAPRREKKVVQPEPLIIPAQPRRRQRNVFGCIANLFIGTFLLLLLGLVLGVVGLTAGYIIIASDLPPVSSLQASNFETVFIFDGNGDLLYSVADPNAGNRTSVSIDEIDADLINATVATEDSRFWENPGFDPVAIGRAVSEVILSGAFTRGDLAAAGGASTITQQLVRATLLSEEERSQTTVQRKIREIILSAELNRTLINKYGGGEEGERLAKREILELYLNEIYYGNLAYGIEAAAQSYFKKPAADLTLAEASLLAGLPQAPALWDPITAPEYATGRQSEVLGLMVSQGYAQFEEAQTALNEALAYDITPPIVNIRYPHFTLGVLRELEEVYGSQAIYGGGFRVYTTIKPDIQRLAEDTLANQRQNIVARGANNAALVAIDPRTGEIQALVGSLDYRDETISGQINMTRVPRQPGSTIKPFVYLAAMERGKTPASLFWDVPSAYPNGVNPPYQPKNYDNEFHGPLLLRPSLANSYNIPAVKALEYVGVCNFINRSSFWGLGLIDDGCNETGQPRNFGLALSLGGGEISPLQMATAFSMLANGGTLQTPISIREIRNKADEVVFNAREAQASIEADSEAITSIRGVSADLAYLMSDMLSDNSARLAEFGQNNLLVIPNHQVAAKTGTSGTNEFDVRDVWTIGYTPEVVTALWVGNTDNTPLGEGASGYGIASPIWNQFITQYLQNRQPAQWTRPDSIIELEICRDSGTLATPDCAERRTELFSRNNQPLPAEDHFFRSTTVDRWTNLEVNEFCNDEEQVRLQDFHLLVGDGSTTEVKQRYEQEVGEWLRGSGSWWAGRYGVQRFAGTVPAPSEGCPQGVERPRLIIQQPFNGDFVQGFVQIGGIATAPGFAGYQVQFGYGDAPVEWFPIGDFQSTPQPGGRLAVWDTSTATQGGRVTIRVVMVGPDNPWTAEADRVRKETRIIVDIPQPTAVPATSTPIPTNTPVPTSVPTDVPTSVPSPTPFPTKTPTLVVPTPTPDAEPTAYP